MTIKKNKVTVVDYGMGNLFNVVRALESINCDVCIADDTGSIASSDRLLLPGVGAFKDGILNLKKSNLLIERRNHLINREIFLNSFESFNFPFFP